MMHKRVGCILLAITTALVVLFLNANQNGFALSEETTPLSQQYVILSEEELLDRIYGGWVGMLIGGLEGLPHEFKYVEKPSPTLPEFTFLANGARSDDDNDIEWLHLWFMHQKGTLKIPYDELPAIWKANMNQGVWVANKRARELMDVGIVPPLTGSIEHNPHAWYNLAGQFCVESYGLIAPGMPQTAADIGLHYARISVSQEPLQATQFWTTLISRAFVLSLSTRELLEDALSAVDQRSDMAHAIRDAIAAHQKYPTDWKAARNEIHQRWYKARGWNANSVIVNGAAVCLALLYGDGDFYQTLRYAMAIGYDADCNAATAGTVVGVRWGFRRISEHPQFRMPDRYQNRTRPQLPQEMRVSEQANILLQLARKVIVEQGGEVMQKDGQIYYRIRQQEPKLLEPLPEVVKRPTPKDKAPS
ncbi:MAG: ADP-ribosylglycohydrolase family protein [Thermogutta sp.]|nr:ADP-ribosylglycohydrolase family protein [Thermogutta sp.]HOP78773.1 ADP-ribosylglycohydrolase family protein [Thermogutta sp.]HPU06308.1 ADP-ribosylglycohydrolase family protein [Thermogutta sp.]HQF13087.1 ADP-ribosylglycohydrolase family protein [Thermogutta sp.]